MCTKGARWPMEEVRREGEGVLPSPSPDSPPTCPDCLLPLEIPLLLVFFPLFVRLLLRGEAQTPASRLHPGLPRRRGPGYTTSP